MVEWDLNCASSMCVSEWKRDEDCVEKVREKNNGKTVTWILSKKGEVIFWWLIFRRNRIHQKVEKMLKKFHFVKNWIEMSPKYVIGLKEQCLMKQFFNL